MEIKEQLNLLNALSGRTSIEELQEYINKVLIIRGFTNQSAKDKLTLLIEEVGELAKAIRKDEEILALDHSRLENYDSIESEIADVFIVLISIANIKNIDILNSIIKKEKINAGRTWR